uniref:Uncharacterized protein n=1 Tax=Ditylenchus dipsaci TaxID=166011 RepID=A0A915EMS4_9BILA
MCHGLSFFSSYISAFLLFRNEGNKSLAIKIVSSGDVVNVDVKLNAEKLEGEISNSELKQHFCLSTVSALLIGPMKILAKWVKSEVHEEAELVHKLKIVRSKEFAALETVMICMVSKVLTSLCLCLRLVWMTLTARPLTMSTVIPKPQCLSRIMSSWICCPPNSAVHTAQDGTRCWLAQLLGDIFQPPMLMLVSRTSKAKILL